MKFKGITWDTPFAEMLKAERAITAWETTKSFREQLKAKADKFERQADVSEHIKAIKAKMERVATQRKFYIHLIEPTGTSTLAFGSHENAQTIFIPKGIVSWEYVQIFKKALEELGFEPDDISMSLESYDEYNKWKLILEW